MISEVIIIKEQDFGDYDKIITFFSSNNGIFSLLCQGINKNKTHNLGSLQYFMHSEIDYFLRTKLKVGKLKTAKCIKIYKNIYKSSKKMLVGNVMLKVISYIEITNMEYNIAFIFLNKYLDMLDINDDKDNFSILFSFLFNYLKLNKIIFNTKYCVRSQIKQNIISINLKDGGYISEKAFNSNTDKIFSNSILKSFKTINEVDVEFFNQLDKKNQIIIWKIVYDYYINELGYFLPIFKIKDI